MSPRVVLAGNNLAAASTLELLLEVCDPPDILSIAPEAGGVAPWQASLELAAREAGVECVTPADVNGPEAAERIRAHEAVLLLSVYYTQIFSDGILEAVDGPMLNFHPSLLPRHRGTAPLIWAIVEGDTTTGLTVHHLDHGVDTGNIVVQRLLPIHPDDTGYQLHRKMAKLVRATAAEIIRAWIDGRAIPPGEPQVGDASYHSSRDPQVNRLDWSLGRSRLRNIVRALAPPLPGAFTYLEDGRLVVSAVEPVDRPGSGPKPHGMIEFGRGEDAPIVWGADGPLRITSFVDDGEIRPGQELPARRRVTDGWILR